MQVEKIEVKKVIANEGKIIISKVVDEEGNPVIKTKELYLADNDNINNYEEIDDENLEDITKTTD